MAYNEFESSGRKFNKLDLNQNIQINTEGAKRNVQIVNNDQEMGNVKEKKPGFFEAQVYN